MNIQKTDPKVYALIQKEYQRQRDSLQLIPSENYTSKAVREAVGSVFMHKYSEGQVKKRYYEGNVIIDEVEQLCKDRALKTFHLDDDWHVNVQALAGSNANLAVYNALIEPGEKIMGMYLYDGGHLSHGWEYKGKKITLSSKIYEVAYYKVNPKTGRFDYDEIDRIAQKERPKIIISGGTAYPREINHKRLSEITRKVNAFYLADVAHEAGLIAAGVNASPFSYADVVTMTTHKTLRGPRGALIFCKKDLAEDIDRSVFPGMQGGPFNHSIAGIAVSLKEAQSRDFERYAKQVVKNAQVLAEELLKLKYTLISGGTDKHLLLVDLRNKEISARLAAFALDNAGITLNRNTIPDEPSSPMYPSGLRLGTPAVTTRGMKEKEMLKIAQYIDQVISLSKTFQTDDIETFANEVKASKEIKNFKRKIKAFCSNFPLPE